MRYKMVTRKYQDEYARCHGCLRFVKAALIDNNSGLCQSCKRQGIVPISLRKKGTKA